MAVSLLAGSRSGSSLFAARTVLGGSPLRVTELLPGWY
jgi:hypothetical protein